MPQLPKRHELPGPQGPSESVRGPHGSSFSACFSSVSGACYADTTSTLQYLYVSICIYSRLKFNGSCDQPMPCMFFLIKIFSLLVGFCALGSFIQALESWRRVTRQARFEKEKILGFIILEARRDFTYIRIISRSNQSTRSVGNRLKQTELAKNVVHTLEEKNQGRAGDESRLLFDPTIHDCSQPCTSYPKSFRDFQGMPVPQIPADLLSLIHLLVKHDLHVLVAALCMQMQIPMSQVCILYAYIHTCIIVYTLYTLQVRHALVWHRVDHFYIVGMR